MLLNRKSSPRYFAHLVRIQFVESISTKTKAFLKEKAVEDFFKLSILKLDEIDIPIRSIRNELFQLQARLLHFFEKEDIAVYYSHNISKPNKNTNTKESHTLVALLIFEPFLGNRRKITQAKCAHLPGLYDEKITNRKTRIRKLTSKNIFDKYYNIAS